MNGSPGNEQGKILGGTILRLGLGVLFTNAALGKFISGYMGFVASMPKAFAETWLPEFMVVPFAYVLPFLEIAVGVLLLVGLFARPTLVVTGLLLIVLSFGMMVQGNHEVVGTNMNYVFMDAVALFLLGAGNPYSLDAIVCGKR